MDIQTFIEDIRADLNSLKHIATNFTDSGHIKLIHDYCDVVEYRVNQYESNTNVTKQFLSDICIYNLENDHIGTDIIKRAYKKEFKKSYNVTIDKLINHIIKTEYYLLQEYKKLDIFKMDL